MVNDYTLVFEDYENCGEPCCLIRIKSCNYISDIIYNGIYDSKIISTIKNTILELTFISLRMDKDSIDKSLDNSCLLFPDEFVKDEHI